MARLKWYRGLPLLASAALVAALPACGGDQGVTSPGAGFVFDDPPPPLFRDVTVHDPSVMRTEDGVFYIVGSHLASAKSEDLISWTQISRDPVPGNPMAPNFREDMAEALEWAQTDTFWAGDWIKLADGRYYLYYCNCRGDSPLSCIGLAVSDAPDGPYENLGVFLRSGMSAELAPDGKLYDAAVHPNAIDPHVFYDEEGKLWMVYGSYSGGICILELDEDSGLPLPDQGYGKKLLGANHSRIEAPYILYSPETEYYYLFLSFGGLGAEDGYNIRCARSRSPDGPYEDARGNAMLDCGGPPGSFFDDEAVEGYGVKLMGNFQFVPLEEEAHATAVAYKSPGHNSAYRDPDTGEYFLIFHTRFEGRGESHQVRVHPFFFNEQGWPVVAPLRYGGERRQSFTEEQLAGTYKVLSHGQGITGEVVRSRPVRLEAGGGIRENGAKAGTWRLLEDGSSLELTLDGTVYQGLFLRQYDSASGSMSMTFTAADNRGISLWGCGAVT